MRTCVIAFLLLSAIAAHPFGFAQSQQSPAVDVSNTNVVAFQEAEYSPLARLAHIEGIVVVQAKLDNKGNVLSATALSGPEILADSSIDNVKKWLFKPNTAKSAIVIYRYEILDGACNGHPTLFVLQGGNVARVLTCPGPINP
jgi:hypothetical protein